MPTRPCTSDKSNVKCALFVFNNHYSSGIVYVKTKDQRVCVKPQAMTVKGYNFIRTLYCFTYIYTDKNNLYFYFFVYVKNYF